ncbi:hypothetical protein AMTRI_Chr04g189220 [Amborella trichopoda]
MPFHLLHMTVQLHISHDLCFMKSRLSVQRICCNDVQHDILQSHGEPSRLRKLTDAIFTHVPTITKCLLGSKKVTIMHYWSGTNDKADQSTGGHASYKCIHWCAPNHQSQIYWNALDHQSTRVHILPEALCVVAKS